MKAAGATWYVLSPSLSISLSLTLWGIRLRFCKLTMGVCVCVCCVGCCAPCASPVCATRGLKCTRRPTKIKLKIAFKKKNERYEGNTQLVYLVFFYFQKKNRGKVRQIKENSKLQFGGAVHGADLFLDSTHESREHKRCASRGREKKGKTVVCTISLCS